MQKSVYTYECIDDWKKFNKISLPEKRDFCSHLNMEDIADAGCVDAKRVFKDFKIKNLGIVIICMLKALQYY